MLDLKGFRDKAKGLPDLLPYAAMVGDGIVLCKDGSFVAGWRYSSQDTASSTDTEMAAVSAQVNNAVRLLGSGWMCHVDAVRHPARNYPQPGESYFPDPVTKLIDEERRQAFNRAGAFYTTETYFVVTYKPRYATDKLVAMAGAESAGNTLEKSLNTFQAQVQELEDSFAATMHLARLREYTRKDSAGRRHTYSELLSHLHFCVTGIYQPILLPDVPMYLDAILGGQELTGGLLPKVGDKYLMVLSLDGLPQESWPSMLAALESLPIPYRFSSRYIFLDQYEAIKEVDKYRKTWRQQVFRFWDAMFNNPNARPNRDALNMSEDAEEAIAEVQSGFVGSGFYTACIVLLDEDYECLAELWARELRKMLQALGFGCRIETLNTLESWMGSHPGNSWANLRRPMINTMNLADLLPLASIWSGSENAPCPFYPEKSPALMYCATSGSTPFRFNLHVGDLGHTLIFGPTGAGKSTLLAIIAAQFRRYPGAAIYCFDKGMSMFPLCKAVGGTHYDVAGDGDSLSFCPLQRVDSDAESSWAEEWIATLCTLQGLEVLPLHRNAIHQAMELLRDNPKEMRSLTDFMHIVQDEQVATSLQHYTSSGAMGRLLDAEADSLGMADFLVFEIEELMNLGDKNLIPVLLYLFHCIEKSLTGQPALLILDEAWIMLGHPVFREKIREWLKVLRKANCAVILSTQTLSDAVRSGILDVLVESCPTKILLPNHTAIQEGQVEIYSGMGLNSRQIEIIASATKKREYYVVSEEGCRLINLALGPLALSFVGASDKESIARIRVLEKEYGSKWPEAWLHERGAA
jgi:type IV secretion system protein VirB4